MQVTLEGLRILGEPQRYLHQASGKTRNEEDPGKYQGFLHGAKGQLDQTGLYK